MHTNESHLSQRIRLSHFTTLVFQLGPPTGSAGQLQRIQSQSVRHFESNLHPVGVDVIRIQFAVTTQQSVSIFDPEQFYSQFFHGGTICDLLEQPSVSRLVASLPAKYDNNFWQKTIALIDEPNTSPMLRSGRSAKVCARRRLSLVICTWNHTRFRK